MYARDSAILPWSFLRKNLQLKLKGISNYFEAGQTPLRPDNREITFTPNG